MAQGNAIVKAVLSGDTVILMGNATNGPPPEMQLTLSSLQAPRLSRNPEQSDEPWAWESREFLRKLCIGKAVTFKVEYKVPAIGRDFGSVMLNGENLCVAVAREGWARVKTVEQSRDGCCKDIEEMLAVEQLAIQGKKGIHNDSPGSSEAATRSVQWSDFDSQALLATNKGKLVPAIIEMVRDGSSFRCILLNTMHMINLSLSGVLCPRMNTPPKDPTAAVKAPEGPAPFAAEAKHFTEVRLLHRNVQLQLEGVDKFGNFFGTVVHPAGNVSVELLKNGLAKMSDWSAAFASMSARTAMRNAERTAKNQQLRLWKGWTAPVLQGDKNYTGTIVEVYSGDTVTVLVPGVGERRVSLSSIRAPRLGNARRGEKDAPFAYEAKEFLRNRAIGKTSTVSIEYEKEPAPGAQGIAAQTRAFGTVIIDKKINIAEAIIAEGLAEVVRHRQDEERSIHYDVLLAAETKARSERKGIHSGKEPSIHRVTDLSIDGSKAKQYLPFLRREKQLKAIVDYVYSGSRVKLYIPKENCMINFALAGIKCPNAARSASQSDTGRSLPAKAAEPFGEEAKLFARSQLNQRNVEVEIEDMDRGGNAFGPLYVGQGDQRKNYAALIVEEGLATVDEYSVERTKIAAELHAAEAVARNAKKKIWIAHQEDKTPKTTTRVEEVIRARVSEIVDGKTLFVHKLPNTQLTNIESEMKAFGVANGMQGRPIEVKRGLICAALFDDGNGPAWNRARIENVSRSGNTTNCFVRYIDYGNVATIPVTKIQPLEGPLSRQPAQAIECVLALLKVPTLDDDFGHEAARTLHEHTWGRDLVCRISGEDQGRQVVSLEEDKVTVNETLVAAGLARIDRKARVSTIQKKLFDELAAAQEAARKSRINMWQYGDIESDDETESSPWGRF